tara:strand:- start:1588 stop:1803 length:216 start_codon:yes stop_codon:yes gene_type:complete
MSISFARVSRSISAKFLQSFEIRKKEESKTEKANLISELKKPADSLIFDEITELHGNEDLANFLNFTNDNK